LSLTLLPSSTNPNRLMNCRTIESQRHLTTFAPIPSREVGILMQGRPKSVDHVSVDTRSDARLPGRAGGRAARVVGDFTDP
jgi:hypothetical protein